MTPYYVVDCSRREYFGPFRTRTRAQAARRHLRAVSDLFLEIGTNVGIVRGKEKTEGYPRGRMREVRNWSRMFR